MVSIKKHQLIILVVCVFTVVFTSFKVEDTWISLSIISLSVIVLYVASLIVGFVEDLLISINYRSNQLMAVSDLTDTLIDIIIMQNNFDELLEGIEISTLTNSDKAIQDIRVKVRDTLFKERQITDKGVMSFTNCVLVRILSDRNCDNLSILFSLASYSDMWD